MSVPGLIGFLGIVSISSLYTRARQCPVRSV
nr:MAG TPA: hypothetical protein [Caudoviricetes sp.]